MAHGPLVFIHKPICVAAAVVVVVDVVVVVACVLQKKISNLSAKHFDYNRSFYK